MSKKPSLSASLRIEMCSPLLNVPGVDALWLGMSPGATLATVGRNARFRNRLHAHAPEALAAVDRATPAWHESLILTTDGVVAWVPVDEEKHLLALVAPEEATPGLLDDLHQVAERLDDWLRAWEGTLLHGVGVQP